MKLRHAELIAIGTELLDPWHPETNGSYLSRRLGEIGIAVRFRVIVGDDVRDLEEAIRTALRRSTLVITTGGLGPTIDDRTRETVAGILGRPLSEDPAIAASLEERYARVGLRMSDGARRQAGVPRGAEVLPNRRGSAPGLVLREGGTTIVLLPGVPAEMRQMVEDSVLSRLTPGTARIARRTLLIAGMSESEVDRRLEPVARDAEAPGWTILASPGRVSIHLSETVDRGAAPRRIERTEERIREILGASVFGVDDDTMEAVVGRLLQGAGGTVAVAESMTGGGVARAITNVPGSSRYFVGGIVCYSDRVKRRAVGVRPETIRAHGAVSEKAAAEMASGVRRRMGATWGLAVTGFAGPGAGAGRSAGEVFVSVRGPRVARVESLSFPGDRAAVRRRAVIGSLDLLRRLLMGAAR